MTDVNLEALLDAMLIGNSQKMQQLRMLIKFAGKCNSSIMITGPSGSGKSTLLSIIGLLDEPTAGDYLLRSENITALTRKQKSLVRNAHIGWIFQNFNLIASMTVLENVVQPMRFNKAIKSSEYIDRAKEALNDVGLLDKHATTPDKLSGGQQQRLEMLSEMVTYMKTANTAGVMVDATTLRNMYANSGYTWTDAPALGMTGSSKQLKSKTAAGDVGVQTMFENYMDYSSDECQSLFTNDQVTVMRHTLMNARSNLQFQPVVNTTATETATIMENESDNICFELGDASESDRKASAEKHIKKIKKLLANVSSLDQDRMLRNYLNVINCSLRTNFYQPNKDGGEKSYISIKIKSADVEEAPKPKPYAEIFVYSPRFEGVHLRSGPVARGGLRWSDRKEDYRTEILGLVKAQQVKNTVIVPVGAKGGFVPKQMPVNPTREVFLEEGINCYKSFISGLLDITDNLKEGAVIPPKDVVRLDDDDPYLVVAADKGTATFSDIANGLANDYGFWLDDAFASGGSVGYDHKKMGITARGAWVSVQRHFREQGIDVQKDSITVAGIGDMSGDVFGNGLLCSEAVKLVAAFDHRDIFIDPDPDPAKSYAERKRMFDLPRSSWEDYNKKLISKGGGIFSRSLKSIDLTPEMKALFGFDEETASATPNELIRAILKSHVDLLWFGGIGTYVKSESESNLEAGDRANDIIRINGKELNCKVVGEGGNLGCTQLGRIEYCLNGGMMNTDAVDNSAGVDCSDNEVNIKILLNSVVAEGKMTKKQRDVLLEEMTDDVADLVLRDNYLQSQAISLAKSSSIRQLDSFVRYLDDLEKTANLDRELEFLPNDEELDDREENALGLTRPENSVLIAYAKMSLFDSLMASNFLDDPYLEKYLFKSFPERLSKKYKNEMRNHQLRSQIIAKVICNDIVNRGGIQAIKEETGASPAEIARAAIITSEVFELENLWDQIEKLDHIAPATIQILMLMDVEEFARRQTIWFLNNTSSKQPIQEIIDSYKPGITALFKMDTSATSSGDTNIANKKNMYTEQNVDETLAEYIASLDVKIAACDLVQVAQELSSDVTDIAKAYFMLGEELGFDWLRNQAELVETADHWDRLAVNSILGDLQDQQKILTRTTLSTCKGKDCVKSAKKWVDDNQSATLRVRKLLEDFQSAGNINVTKMGFAARQIRNVVVD